MKRFIAYLILLFIALACSPGLEKEITSKGLDPALEGKPVTITFSVPEVGLASSTKSLDDGEGDIGPAPYLDPDKLYLAVCGHSQSIKYIRKAEMDVDGDGNPITTKVPVADIKDYPLPTEGVSTITMYQFKVQLELSDGDRTIHFLGNIDENQLTSGAYSYQILPTLVSYAGKQAYWQKVFLPSIKPKYENNIPIIVNGSYVPDEDTEARLRYVPLIRNYAKIQVTDATDPNDGFELFSYAVIYYPTRGSVVPYRSNVTGGVDPFSFGVSYDSEGNPTDRLSGYEKCDFNKLDKELDYLGYLLPNYVFDEDIPAEEYFEHPENSNGRVIKYDKNNPDLGFYIYERTIPSDKLDPTFVIIRGKFGDGNEYYYYRLDLMEIKSVGNESVYQYYPIYRNFRYNIQLNRISSIGVSSPELAAKSSGIKDISADISMRHLNDISNGVTRLVVEPFMSKTYTGPNEEGYYYIYARFFNDLNSPNPNTDWGAVSVELEAMSDQSDDILTLYDDVGNEVHAFYPSSQEMGGEQGFRIIRFNTKAPGNETKTQKIKISGRNLYAHEEYPLYREVEITLQKKQTMTVKCNQQELPLYKGAKQEIMVTIPAGLQESMFPLEFTIEAELPTLTPDNSVAGNNIPVSSGPSISDNVIYAGKHAIQFIRTLTLDEYKKLPVVDGKCTFSSYFRSNRARSATTVWVQNDYFNKGSDSFVNAEEPTGHFWVKADENAETTTCVKINKSNLQYKIDDEEWNDYKQNNVIELERGHKVSFRSKVTIDSWNGGVFKCYKKSSSDTAKDGVFSVGGNIASLIMGNDYVSEAESYKGNYTFLDFFKGHINLTDAYELVIPMLSCNSEGCFKSFFDGCTSLTRGPEKLPATKMSKTCYRNFFLNCSSLAYAPELPATKIENQCYQQMFRGCASLLLIKMNGANYVADCFTDWVTGLPGDGEIWLNPDIKNSKSWESVIPISGDKRWTVRKMPNGDVWTN